MNEPLPPSSAEKPRAASDNLCKRLVDAHPTQFIEWLFKVKVETAQPLKTELSREPVRADALMLWESGDETFHIEFQTTAKSHVPVPLRMLDYYVGCKRLAPERRVWQAVVVLKESGDELADYYEDIHSQAFLRYQVIKLWEQDPRAIMRYDGLLPLAVLARAEKSGEQLLRQVARQIRAVPDKIEQRDQFKAAQIFAGLRYSQEKIYRILLGGDMLEESVIYQDIIQKGHQQGRQEGWLQGGLERERHALLLLLMQKFGKITPAAHKGLESLSLTQLDELVLSLRDFQTYQDFTVWLRARKTF